MEGDLASLGGGAVESFRSRLISEIRRETSDRVEAVDLALRRLVGVPLTREFRLGLGGVGWDGDLDTLRREKPDVFARF